MSNEPNKTADTEPSAETIPSSSLSLRFDQQTQDIYIDGYDGAAVINGVVRLNLNRDRMVVSDGVRSLERYIPIQLFLSLESLIRVQTGLSRLVENLIQDGFISTDQAEKIRNSVPNAE